MNIPGVSTHAGERMAEHHGRDLTAEEWRAVVLAVCDRRAVLVREAYMASGAIYDVELVGMRFRVVWKPESGIIATVLQDCASTSQRASQAKREGIRSSVRMGRGFYDREGNRI